VLDLGSGNGIPAARILAGRFRVTGVDISDVQVRRARRLVPRARFVRADLSEIDFSPSSFAAVISLYSLIHVPREQHRPLFRKIARWLVPGGWFLATLGHSAYEGQESGWLGSGAPMLWSHYDAATYRRGLGAEGFRIVREQFIPEGDGGHQLFLTRTRAPGSVRRTSAPKAAER
jgi:SAM-dependent methyltransferase